MSDPVSSPPALSSGPQDLLPLWLRDWRVFALLILLLLFGGQEVRDAVRGLLGLGTSPAQAQTCEALTPRVVALEEGMSRNDIAHRQIATTQQRILVLLQAKVEPIPATVLPPAGRTQ